MRISLSSPPSEPKFTTVPVPSTNRSATAPNSRPPTLSMATWIWRPPAAPRTRSVQPSVSVANTGEPGTSFASAAAPASLRTSRIGRTPRSIKSLTISRPTADPAAVTTATTSSRASGGTESCAVRSAISAVTVLISICAAIASDTLSGSGTSDPAGTTTCSLHVEPAGKNATRAPGLMPNAGSTSRPTSVTTPAPSNPGIRPPDPIAGGVPAAGDPFTPRRSPGWIGA